MSKGIFITGTGTDIGKTYVTALIVKKLRDAGLDAGYYKAAVSGNDWKDGKLVPGDAAEVKHVASLPDELEDMVSFVYEHAVSPHLASRIEGNPVTMETVKRDYEHCCKKHDYVTMEGSGGILCPICFDERELWLEDIIKELGLASIIVADAGLGTINNVVLTVEYMKMKSMEVKGIILNHYHSGDVMEEDNIRMIEHRTGVKVLACVSDGEKELAVNVQELAGLYN